MARGAGDAVDHALAHRIPGGLHRVGRDRCPRTPRQCGRLPRIQRRRRQLFERLEREVGRSPDAKRFRLDVAGCRPAQRHQYPLGRYEPDHRVGYDRNIELRGRHRWRHAGGDGLRLQHLAIVVCGCRNARRRRLILRRRFDHRRPGGRRTGRPGGRNRVDHQQPLLGTALRRRLFRADRECHRERRLQGYVHGLPRRPDGDDQGGGCRSGFDRLRGRCRQRRQDRVDDRRDLHDHHALAARLAAQSVPTAARGDRPAARHQHMVAEDLRIE